MSLQRVGDLEIAQDLGFLRRMWVAQRVGWGIMLLVLLAALAGLCGSGPLSRARAGDGQLQLEYGRFGRYQTPGELRLTVGPGVARDGKLAVWLSHAYLDEVHVQQVSPEPESVESGPDRLIYTFQVSQPDRPARLTFEIQPWQAGLIEGQLGLSEREAVRFSQLVYP